MHRDLSTTILSLLDRGIFASRRDEMFVEKTTEPKIFVP
jgi:hypothetical protein